MKATRVGKEYNVIRIADARAAERDWTPTRPGAEVPIWGIPSPDGKHLALALATDDSNVYMVENF
jgi:hypothetical protein